MDHMEMVEKLRAKTGLSYEAARAALEKADWDMLDALIALEKEGKVREDGASYSTREEEPKAEETAKKKDGDSFTDMLRRFWNWIKRTVHRGNVNALCMDKNSETLIRLPVNVFILLLILAFWVVLPLMVVALFFGCRFLFRGPDLGRENINNVMGKATDVADDIKSEFKNAAEKKDA